MVTGFVLSSVQFHGLEKIIFQMYLCTPLFALCINIKKQQSVTLRVNIYFIGFLFPSNIQENIIGRPQSTLILHSISVYIIVSRSTSFCSRAAIEVFFGSSIRIAPAPKVCTASLNLSIVRSDNLVTTQRLVSMSEVRGLASIFTNELREPEKCQ